jgi:regulatory protein YycI of two-component signal transduction system YycFG
MDWNKTKGLFIVVFLILDVFLLYQFLDFRAAKLEINKDSDSTIEDRLKAEGIKYHVGTQERVSEKTISAKPKEFSKEELNTLKNQTFIIDNKRTIRSTLDKPIKIGTGEGKYFELESFINKNVYSGDEYEFWRKEDGTITYYQTYKSRLLFNNKNGALIFTLNENDEVISYMQTHLDDIEEFNENQEINPPIQAVESLLNGGYLSSGSEVSKGKLGFYTLIEVSESKVLVLVPTWHFTVNKQEDYFVNGIEGQVLNTEEGNVTE